MNRTLPALIVLAVTALLLNVVGCSHRGASSKKPAAIAKSGVICGADRTDQYVPYLKGKRVALVANQTSIIDGKPSLDVLPSLGVNVVKAFGPEHGFRGQASNGAKVGDEIDPKTGIPILSLYGVRKKPTKEDLSDVDVVIYDMQDMGVRFYTNINVMRNVMDSCAENDKEFIVFDRPNPHGYMVDGPVLDMQFKSGIGQFPIPIAHGMTVGEFAQMINGEGWLSNPSGPKCKLKVIPVANYTHDTPYMLPVNPSPNLNTPQAVMLYPSTCLFEGVTVNHGRGTQYPFTILGAPSLKGKYTFSFTPTGIPGMSENPIYKDEVCYGIDLRNYDTSELRRKRQINLNWMKELYAAYPDKANFFNSKFHKQVGSIDKLAGVAEFKQQIIDGKSEDEIRATWQPGLAAFREKRQKYLIYQ